MTGKRPSIVDAFAKLREACAGSYDGVDADAHVRRLRGHEPDDLDFGDSDDGPPPPGPGECAKCYAQPGTRDHDCGASDCPHGECLHHHHDGCPRC